MKHHKSASQTFEVKAEVRYKNKNTGDLADTTSRR